MKLSAKDLLDLQIIDEIVDEPIGGAHRDRNSILKKVKDSISKNLDNFKDMSAEEIFNDRKNKFLRIGRSKGFITNLNELSSLKTSQDDLRQILKSKKIPISIIILSMIAIVGLIIFL